MPLYSLPPTPDASPCDWDQNMSRGPTPLGHAAAVHPAGAPLYGLGFSPTLFEEHLEDELEVVSIGGERARRRDFRSAPPLKPPPFVNARPRRATLPLPECTPDFDIVPAKTTTLRQRRQRAQRNRNVIWAVVLCWTIFFVFTKIFRTAVFTDWMEKNAKWSAQLSQFTGDSMHGLEEDFTPSTRPVYFHRTQRLRYERYIADRTRIEKGISSLNANQDNPQVDGSALPTGISASLAESSAIAEVIDNMLLWPDVESHTSGRGHLRGVYHEALVALHDIDPIFDIGADELSSLLEQTDGRRRRAIQAMVRRVKVEELPSGWRNPSSFELLMSRIWTRSDDSSDIFGENTLEGATERSGDFAPSTDVVVFTKGPSPLSRRIQIYLHSRYNAEFVLIDLAARDDGDIIESFLRRLTGHDALPHWLIGTESIDDWDEVEHLQSPGLHNERPSKEKA
ncbi:hypothetical protein NliqN6_6576 [Naganishia liquefaciens]|uniref:Uncharacterized protein n=1 Tax=Naganishia liquefaciens TaxID=104408 RepID=A0A8H3YHR3_9TREE|nr:hypothetical protein NliqN6_6576 [Naganishia liquefaciens]